MRRLLTIFFYFYIGHACIYGDFNVIFFVGYFSILRMLRNSAICREFTYYIVCTFYLFEREYFNFVVSGKENMRNARC